MIPARMITAEMLSVPDKKIAYRVERAQKITEFCEGQGMSVAEMCDACIGVLVVYSRCQLKRMLADANEEVKGDVSNA
jgi:hypothetical protein